MNALLKFVGTLAVAVGITTAPAFAEIKLTVPGGSPPAPTWTT